MHACTEHLLARWLNTLSLNSELIKENWSCLYVSQHSINWNSYASLIPHLQNWGREILFTSFSQQFYQYIHPRLLRFLWSITFDSCTKRTKFPSICSFVSFVTHKRPACAQWKRGSERWLRVQCCCSRWCLTHTAGVGGHTGPDYLTAENACLSN